jgi:hypothetical protein
MFLIGRRRTLCDCFEPSLFTTALSGTQLRKNRVPKDLIRFWMGPANVAVTDGYSQMKQDVPFWQLCAANGGLGFEIPAAQPLHCTVDTENAVMEQFA